MDLTPYLRSLRDDLMAAAAIGDEQVRRAADVLSGAIEPSARLALMNALSDFAAEVTQALEHVVVDLRLDGRDVKVSVTEHTPADPVDAEQPDPRDDRWSEADKLRRAVQDAGGELSRTTVRLFHDLKSEAEVAASDQGVSLNTYISRAVSDAVRAAATGNKPRKGGRRTVSGFVQA